MAAEKTLKPIKFTRWQIFKLLIAAGIIRFINLFWMLILMIFFLLLFTPMLLKPSLMKKYKQVLDKGVL